MFIFFIDVKINTIKFYILNQSVCKLVIIYNNVQNKKFNILAYDYDNKFIDKLYNVK